MGYGYEYPAAKIINDTAAHTGRFGKMVALQDSVIDTIVSEIVIDPYQTETISFTPNQQDQSTEIALTIYPKFHNYAIIDKLAVNHKLNSDFSAESKQISYAIIDKLAANRELN